MGAWVRASGVQETNAGTYTYTPDSGVYQVTVALWGGGASGGSGFKAGPDFASGQGGGGGEYRSSLVSVTPGSPYTVIIGGGGSASDGVASSFASTTVVAKPGLVIGTGGSGGTGTTGHNGGTGSNLDGGTSAGGGGGGSGGTSVVGNTATSQTGATAVTGGGNGGNGGNSNTVGSAPTTAPGGGGGGGGLPSVNGTKAGGAGKAGAGTLTWATVYTVTFNANGGTGSGTEDSNISRALTSVATLGISRTGYFFTGWNTAANGSGTAYADGATYNFPTNHSVTLYAQWDQYTLTFNANGGSGSATQNYSGTTTLSPFSGMGITFTGFTFTGWNTAANGSGTAYADGASYNFTADVTLYAQWSAAILGGSTLGLMGVG